MPALAHAVTEQGIDRDAVLAVSLLGGGLPAMAAFHLREAAFAYADDRRAEAHLASADMFAPDHAAVLIGRYRYYFYKNRLGDALEVAEACLRKAARDNGLPEDWRRVSAADASFSQYDAALPRFFLFTLKAYGYLQMRLGRLVEGRDVVDKLLELDPTDKVGAGVLLGILDRAGRTDDE